MTAGSHVGTLGEKPLHAALKRWYATGGDLVEEPVDGFVIDLVRDGLLIEIQTRSFSSMKRKLTKLLSAGHEIRIVHPIAVDKWIVKLDEAGNEASRRKSPKRGAVVDVFAELVSFPGLITHPRLSIDVVLTRQDELRRFDPSKAWRRRGWVVEERRLIEVIDTVAIRSAADLVGLLPADLPAEFTTADLADALGRTRRLAQRTAYCLRNVGAIKAVGKDGNAVVYRRD